MRFVVGHQVLVGLLPLPESHVVEVDAGVDVDEVAGVDGHQRVGGDEPLREQPVPVGQVLQGRIVQVPARRQGIQKKRQSV